MPDPIEALEAQRAALLKDLAQLGDMRRGSITEVYRRCGKHPCCCEDPAHPGHGPYYAFTTKVAGKTKTLQLRPGARLARLEREVETYRRFRTLSEQLLAVSEALCAARPVGAAGESPEGTPLKKKLRRRSRRKSRGR